MCVHVCACGCGCVRVCGCVRRGIRHIWLQKARKATEHLFQSTSLSMLCRSSHRRGNHFEPSNILAASGLKTHLNAGKFAGSKYTEENFCHRLGWFRFGVFCIFSFFFFFRFFGPNLSEVENWVLSFKTIGGPVVSVIGIGPSNLSLTPAECSVRKFGKERNSFGWSSTEFRFLS